MTSGCDSEPAHGAESEGFGKQRFPKFPSAAAAGPKASGPPLAGAGQPEPLHRDQGLPHRQRDIDAPAARARRRKGGETETVWPQRRVAADGARELQPLAVRGPQGLDDARPKLQDPERPGDPRAMPESPADSVLRAWAVAAEDLKGGHGTAPGLELDRVAAGASLRFLLPAPPGSGRAGACCRLSRRLLCHPSKVS